MGGGGFHHKLRKEEWVEQEWQDLAVVGCIRKFWGMGSGWSMVSKIKTHIELSRKKEWRDIRYVEGYYHAPGFSWRKQLLCIQAFPLRQTHHR